MMPATPVPSGLRSGLYVGGVTHQRLRPRRHRLAYRVYALLLDLDELPALPQRLRVFSLKRFNLMSFFERDHGEGSSTPLAEQIRSQLRNAGLAHDGPIRLLAMPRILGHGFNPLSVYFCHAADGRLAALVYEVHNTFGERHSYLIEVPAGSDPAQALTQHCDKVFHVSPFMAMDLRYRFSLRPPALDAAPGSELRVDIGCDDPQGPMLQADWHLHRRELTDAALLRVFFSHPLLTLKVVAGIHWEALKLLLKGLPFFRHPGPAPQPLTVIRTSQP